MTYGASELNYAKPFADALVASADFRRWVLSQTKFAARAEGARLLHEEMLKARSRNVKSWWRSHFSEKCTCPGCHGQETDMLAIFEDEGGERFALHVEVKHPGDHFKEKGDQAEAYPMRARCWAAKPPAKVLPHSDATTMLLCSASRLCDYEHHLGHFGSVLTFETVAGQFPRLYDHDQAGRIRVGTCGVPRRASAVGSSEFPAWVWVEVRFGIVDSRDVDQDRWHPGETYDIRQAGALRGSAVHTRKSKGRSSFGISRSAKLTTR